MCWVHSTSLGYGRYGVKLAAALDRQSVDVVAGLGENEPDSRICNTVCWISTPGHARGWYDGQYKVISTMWEASVLPEAFRENLHEFDMVVVPSQHNLELFSRYHDNVKKVWLGVDTDEWKPVDRQPPEDRFNFLIGGSGKRKGTDLAYRAFKRVFRDPPKDGPTPYLIMKSPRPEDFYGERIERIGGRISDREERDLYGMAHCYLQPSRGEGWGLQPLQAMATGMPTILTNAHGHAEFAEYGIPIGHTMSKSDYFIYGDAGDWWEPNLDELCDAMWDVYRNYPTHLERAKKNAHFIGETYSWDACATRFRNAVGDQLCRPYAGEGRWEAPSPKRYLVRVVKPWKADIAGVHYQFMPGHDYHETADVKRILFEGMVLDTSCVISNPTGEVQEHEIGLSEAQLEQVPMYTAAMARCWTCGQVLNSGTLADV